MNLAAGKKCTHKDGCDSLGTAQVVLILSSACGIVQKFTVPEEMRCAIHRPDDPWHFVKRSAYEMLARRFEQAAFRHLKRSVLPIRDRFRVFYAEAGADVTTIPVYVPVPSPEGGSLERVGDARVVSDRLTRGTGTR